jgi:hypothetical protein
MPASSPPNHRFALHSSDSFAIIALLWNSLAVYGSFLQVALPRTKRSAVGSLVLLSPSVGALNGSTVDL